MQGGEGPPLGAFPELVQDVRKFGLGLAGIEGGAEGFRRRLIEGAFFRVAPQPLAQGGVAVCAVARLGRQAPQQISFGQFAQQVEGQAGRKLGALENQAEQPSS